MADETLRARRDRIKVGDVFGLWTVLALADGDRRKVICRCRCGRERPVDVFSLKSGGSLSCGCRQSEKAIAGHARRRKFAINPGDVFGRLTVIGAVEGGVKWWDCRCECGALKTVRRDHLATGRVVSCGCYRKSGPMRTHGMSRSTEYGCWHDMKDRCTNPNSSAYKDYGERGICVCPEWVDSFETFYRNMGPRPSPKHSIDRINVNGNYELGNTKWATHLEQAQNTRRSRHLTAFGRTQSLAMWSRETAICDETIRERLKRGWPVEDALSVTPDLRKPHRS